MMVLDELVQRYYHWLLGGDTRDGLNLLDVFYLSVYVAFYVLTRSIVLWYTFN